MFAIGCAVSDLSVFEQVALPSLRPAMEPDTVLLTRQGHASIQQPYNEMMEEAAGLPDLEGLILVHQDMELTDASLLARVRPLLREPRVGVVGVLGGRGVPPHCWWEAEEMFGHARTPIVDVRHSVGSHEVEVVDGALLALAPWVVRELRFSEELADDFHGYDFELCLQVRAARGRVICDDIPYLHHMSRPWADGEQYMRAGRALARRWGRDLDPRERIPSFPP
jgi:hypothetical protein